MAFRRATGAAPRTFRQQFAKGGFVARQGAAEALAGKWQTVDK